MPRAKIDRFVAPNQTDPGGHDTGSIFHAVFIDIEDHGDAIVMYNSNLTNLAKDASRMVDALNA